MRLASFPPDDKLTITEFPPGHKEKFAILSHVWEEQEITYADWKTSDYEEKTGYRKVNFCRQQAAKDKLEYFWIDTCCINRDSSAELSEAINSMFQWYKKASKCYVYLSDVSVCTEGIAGHRPLWEPAFLRSAWFTRGWTLQELLAPARVEFFSSEGVYLGDKTSLEDLIVAATGIDFRALRGRPLSYFPVEERMSWAANRKTTLGEDKAYCQVGLLEVAISEKYGQGEVKAMRMLERALKSEQQDLKEKRQQTQRNLPISSKFKTTRESAPMDLDLYYLRSGCYALFSNIDLVLTRRPSCVDTDCKDLEEPVYICTGCGHDFQFSNAVPCNDLSALVRGRALHEHCARGLIDEQDGHKADHILVEWCPWLVCNFDAILDRDDLTSKFEDTFSKAFQFSTEFGTILGPTQPGESTHESARYALLPVNAPPGDYRFKFKYVLEERCCRHHSEADTSKRRSLDSCCSSNQPKRSYPLRTKFSHVILTDEVSSLSLEDVVTWPIESRLIEADASSCTITISDEISLIDKQSILFIIEFPGNEHSCFTWKPSYLRLTPIVNGQFFATSQQLDEVKLEREQEYNHLRAESKRAQEAKDKRCEKEEWLEEIYNLTQQLTSVKRKLDLMGLEKNARSSSSFTDEHKAPLNRKMPRLDSSSVKVTPLKEYQSKSSIPDWRLPQKANAVNHLAAHYPFGKKEFMEQLSRQKNQLRLNPIVPDRAMEMAERVRQANSGLEKSYAPSAIEHDVAAYQQHLRKPIHIEQYPLVPHALSKNPKLSIPSHVDQVRLPGYQKDGLQLSQKQWGTSPAQVIAALGTWSQSAPRRDGLQNTGLMVPARGPTDIVQGFRIPYGKQTPPLGSPLGSRESITLKPWEQYGQQPINLKSPFRNTELNSLGSRKQDPKSHAATGIQSRIANEYVQNTPKPSLRPNVGAGNRAQSSRYI